MKMKTSTAVGLVVSAAIWSVGLFIFFLPYLLEGAFRLLENL
jgi:hypothetical protein